MWVAIILWDLLFLKISVGCVWEIILFVMCLRVILRNNLGEIVRNIFFGLFFEMVFKYIIGGVVFYIYFILVFRGSGFYNVVVIYTFSKKDLWK